MSALSLPRRVYHLSATGWQETERIRACLSEDVVEIWSPALGKVTSVVFDIPGLVSPPLSLTTVVSMVEEGHIDLSRPRTRVPNADGPVIWGEGVRIADRVFGRKHEFKALDEWRGSESKAILITGLAGIG